MLKNILKTKWMWLLYMILFGAFSLQRMIDFFSPDQAPYLYYQILMIFSVNKGILPLNYIFAILAMILNVITFIILWFYIFGKLSFSASFIALIILTKIVSDFYGHSFEWNIIKSLSFESPLLAWQIGGNLFLWLLPAYLALSDYILKKVRVKQQAVI